MTTLEKGTAGAQGSGASERVTDLIARMTLDEKLAQLVGFWQDKEGDVVAPLQGQQAGSERFEDAIGHGLGHITRVYGTNPVDAVERAQWLWETQRDLVRNTRLGIPAIVHEECLIGFAMWKAATFPTPTAWGASFAPDLVQEMAALIGESMHALGVHQGLAPVLDVIRDPRWGRVDECIAEDPYLVGSVGTAFVRGLQSSGVHATLKHFVGYSASQAGRNFAPVHAGPRELADSLLIPFEMAIKDGNARSVMHSYAEIDGIPSAANEELLTGVLRDEWGFDGVVVADYFGVAFLHVLHGVAADRSEAGAQALTAGVDVELPTGDSYLGPLAEAVASGRVSESLVDRALERVLRQKEALGLLDETFEDEPPAAIDLDSPEHRRLAREIAERSIVLLSNDGTLPLERGSATAQHSSTAQPASIALIGPNADRPAALFGCYSFVNHVLVHRPGVEPGFAAPSVREALEAEFPGAVRFAQGCAVNDLDRSGFDEAVAAAKAADVAVIVAGDHAGLFGGGTVGEGCDVESLELPGVQRELIEAVLDAGTPVVLVLMTGRPYAVDWALERCAAVLQTFFPGEEGAGALAGVLSGRVNPSGHLPVTMPRSVGAQPYTYLHPQLGGTGELSTVATEPARPFGFGLSYSEFAYAGFAVDPVTPTGSPLRASVTVTNTSAVDGEDVVQLYARDLYRSVTRPLAQLVGYQRVALKAGESATVSFEVPANRIAFSDRSMTRVVEPGDLDLWVGDSATRVVEARTELVGPVHAVDPDGPRLTVAAVSK